MCDEVSLQIWALSSTTTIPRRIPQIIRGSMAEYGSRNKTIPKACLLGKFWLGRKDY